MTKAELLIQLRAQNAFWSYVKDAHIPDPILIEHTLRSGEPPQIIALFSLFEKSYVQEIWEQELIPDERIYRHNYYLARIFFGIPDTEAFLDDRKQKYSRFARLQQLTS